MISLTKFIFLFFSRSCLSCLLNFRYLTLDLHDQFKSQRGVKALKLSIFIDEK